MKCETCIHYQGEPATEIEVFLSPQCRYNAPPWPNVRPTDWCSKYSDGSLEPPAELLVAIPSVYAKKMLKSSFFDRELQAIVKSCISTAFIQLSQRLDKTAAKPHY
jgi:hypothetical protein